MDISLNVMLPRRYWPPWQGNVRALHEITALHEMGAKAESELKTLLASDNQRYRARALIHGGQEFFESV